MGREEAAPGESLRANEGAKDNEPAKEAEGAPNEFKGNTVIGGAKVSTSRRYSSALHGSILWRTCPMKMKVSGQL